MSPRARFLVVAPLALSVVVGTAVEPAPSAIAATPRSMLAPDDPARTSIAEAATAREEAGLPPLRRTKRLNRIARKYARASAKAGEILPLTELDELLVAVRRPTIAGNGLVDADGASVPITAPPGESRRPISELAAHPAVGEYGVGNARDADGARYQGVVLGARRRDEAARTALEAQALAVLNRYRQTQRAPEFVVDPALRAIAHEIGATAEAGAPNPPGTTYYWYFEPPHDFLFEAVLDVEYLEETFDRPGWENIRLSMRDPTPGRVAAAYVTGRTDGAARLVFVFA